MWFMRDNHYATISTPLEILILFPHVNCTGILITVLWHHCSTGEDVPYIFICIFCWNYIQFRVTNLNQFDNHSLTHFIVIPAICLIIDRFYVMEFYLSASSLSRCSVSPLLLAIVKFIRILRINNLHPL